MKKLIIPILLIVLFLGCGKKCPKICPDFPVPPERVAFQLDRMAGEPVDLMVNNKVVAKGEVVVVDESFGIRIVSLVSAEERIKSLR